MGKSGLGRSLCSSSLSERAASGDSCPRGTPPGRGIRTKGDALGSGPLQESKLVPHIIVIMILTDHVVLSGSGVVLEPALVGDS